MTNPQVVEAYTTKTVITPHDVTTKFEFRADRPMRWLQRVLFWALRKLRCWAIVDEVSCTRISIDTGKFAEALYRQNSELLSMYHLRGERLLIGAEDFHNLMKTPEFNQTLSFTAPYASWDSRSGQTILGLKVTIIPWMRGMLVLPKDL